MTKNRFIITPYQGQILTTYFEDNKPLQIHLEKEEQTAALGNIYVAKVKNIVNNIQAAFVEIQPKVICYLSLTEAKNPIFVNRKNDQEIKPGDDLIVQLSKEGIKTKTPAVTTRLSFSGKYVVLTYGGNSVAVSNQIKHVPEIKRLKELAREVLSPDCSLIIRTNAEGKTDEIREEIERLDKKLHQIIETGKHKVCFSVLHKELPAYLNFLKGRMIPDTDEITTDDEMIYQDIRQYLMEYQPEDLEKLVFYDDKMISLFHLYGMEHHLSQALNKNVWLKSGGSIVIEPTEALTVIDVNTGKAIKGKKKNIEETFLAINLEAAIEIARQIQLRNLSGIIIVDFVDMEEEEHKKQLLTVLRKELMKDSVRTTLIDMTPLGLVEITRKKIRKPLHEQFKRGE